MKFVIAYAGIPAGEAFDYINKMRQTLVGANTEFIGFPLRRFSGGLSPDYAQPFLESFERRLATEFDKATNFIKTSCAIIYLCADETANAAFEQQFFPAILPIAVSWESRGNSPDERRESEKKLFATLLTTTIRTRSILQALQRPLREQANKTPLLLPIRNFESRTYVGWLRTLQTNITSAENEQSASEIIRQAAEAFETIHPRQQVSGTCKRSFLDEREVEFRAPGAGRMHGLPSLKSAHPSQQCKLAAFRRLGAPFNAAFHYDAQKDSPKPLKGMFCGCHGAKSMMTGEPHLNIAPNDFIRI